MAKLSKDIYDKKASWAAARMLSNKSIKSLTEEQHDAISEIASIRHNLHVSSGGNPNRYDVEGYHNFFGATFLDSKGKLMEIIEENNLPKFKPYLIIDEFTYLGGDDWNDDEIDGYDENLDLDSKDYDKKYDAYLNIVLDNIELLDQSVRDYLAYIDYLYGTNYSPSRGDYSKYVEEPKKMAKGGEIKATTDGKKGGLLYGKSHAQGGIKAVVTDAGNKEIELEGGEAVVKKSALKDKTVKTLTGTNAEILNKINTEAGGNPIYAPSEVKMKNGGSVGSDILSPYLENLKINGIVLYDKDLIVLMYNTGSQKRNKNLYSPTILRKYLNDYSEEVANQLTLDLAMEWYDLFDEKDISKYLKHDRIIVVNNSKVVFDNQANMAKGGSITPSAISKMTKAEQKAFYKTKEGKELDKQTHAKWKSLVNMSKGELESFYNSKEGKEAGLSASEAKAEGIDSGRESARWIMKMKDIPYTEWTSNMWVWAKKQISFVSRMKGMKGDLYDDKGNKTRKHLALLIWGHNPKKMAEGGSIESDCISFIKKSEAIKNNGYFHYFKNISVYANFGAKDPKVKSFYLCSYNSGGQKNLKVTDTINLDLVNKLQSIIGCEKGVCIIIIDEFMRKAKRVEKNDLKRMARENILVVDRDKVTCDNINSKMAEGGNVGDSKLLAPNGKPSNLTAEQYKLVRTDAFKKWFGDWENDAENASKVVDENGEPLVVYHGTNVEFYEFDLKYFGKTDKGWYGKGFYFTPNKNFTFAKDTVELYGGKEIKLDLFLKIINPLYGEAHAEQNSNLVSSAKDRDRDGVIILYDYGHEKERQIAEIIVWNPNQIKLADGTNTTFDGSNDDIRFAEGGNVGDSYSKTLSSISRFKPKETIFFNPPLVGVNGAKLISYTWAYEWTMLPNREGEMKDKRVSDWTKAESSAETGRDIVHQYTIEEQDGSLKTVSSESVPILLGYSNKSQSKTFGNLATASKTLAKQQMELSILEAKKNDFDDALKSITENGFPNPKVVKGDGFRPYKLFIGDASCWINDDGIYNEERLECAKQGYIHNRLSEIGINYYSYSAIPSRIYDVKKRIEKQKRKINEILSADKMAEGGNVGNYYNNEQETMIEEPLMFEEGGVVSSDKTPEELAKDFVNSLPQDVIQEMKDKYNALIAEMVVNEKNALDAINNEISELEAKKEALSGDRSDDAFKKRSEYYTSIRQKQNGLRHQTNRYYAMKNGGSLATFTDKKGVEHKDIPDFTKIGSEDISFDEENILTQTPPQYIPVISEDSFKDKGYLFDAIRYSSDTYIIAVNGYRETLLKGYEYTNEHPSDSEQGYALVTLDQLILINDYYYTKAKATERKKAEETNKRTEERWDRMPREDRERYYASKYFYESMPVSVKKKITKDSWDLLTLEQKEGFYKPIKIVQGKRLVSKLDDDKMWASFHNMYERFLNPEVKIRIEKGVKYGHPEVFSYWYAFRDMMKWKLKDIKFQRQFLSDIRKTALETSFGMSNTNDTLYDRLGILVKRQNGSSIKPLEIEQISAGWHNINRVYGGLVSLAKEEAMKISHTGTTLVFASKAAGVYIPSMKTIAVSAKYGDEMFQNILAHEVAHWIDNKIGEQNRLRWATDNYESTAGMIASTFRKRMNVKSESDYINATKECFARALEQFFAISVFGENATVFPDPLHPDLSMIYFQSPNYVNKAVYESTMKPLIEKFFQENKDFFKYGIETNVADANVSKEVAPITTPMEVKTEVVMNKEERLRKEFDDLAKSDTMTDAQKATIERIADNLADKLKGVEIPTKTETEDEEDVLKDLQKYSSPKKYNSEIEVGKRYYDNRYQDYYTIEKMTETYSGGDVTAILKYDKGTTRKESGDFILYHIDNKQHSLSKESPKEVAPIITPSKEKADEAMSKENLLASLEGAKVAVEFLEGQQKQDMIDYIEGLETLIEIL